MLVEKIIKIRLFYEKELNENEDLIFEAQVYNDSYELENKKIFNISNDSNNKEFEYTDRIGDKYILNVGSNLIIIQLQKLKKKL